MRENVVGFSVPPRAAHNHHGSPHQADGEDHSEDCEQDDDLLWDPRLVLGFRIVPLQRLMAMLFPVWAEPFQS